jgi:hypothetical protein
VEELSRLIQRISQVMLQFQGMEFGSYWMKTRDLTMQVSIFLLLIEPD